MWNGAQGGGGGRWHPPQEVGPVGRSGVLAGAEQVEAEEGAGGALQLGDGGVCRVPGVEARRRRRLGKNSPDWRRVWRENIHGNKGIHQSETAGGRIRAKNEVDPHFWLEPAFRKGRLHPWERWRCGRSTFVCGPVCLSGSTPASQG